MDIKRLNKNQIRCTITEQEIEELGFQIDDIIFNVWVEDDVTTAITDSATGVYIDTPMHIFNTKKSYNRLKDIKDLSDIAKLILS